MTPVQIATVLIMCTQHFAPSTAQHVIQAESSGNPLAIGVNGHRLRRQPQSKAQAIAWARWLVVHRYNIDVGLWQVNIANWKTYGITPENAFDPCRNTMAGSAVFTRFYLRAARKYGAGQTALLHAISAYNTGDFSSGFANGYVERVIRATSPGNRFASKYLSDADVQRERP